MDGLRELLKNKAKSPLNAMYFDEKYDIPNQANLLPADVPNNPSTSVNLPPPLPGVYVFDQPHQSTNKSLIDSNFNPLVTSSYDNHAQTLSKICPPNANKYSEVGGSVPETISNQKYFQSPPLNMYDYQTSDQKKPNRLPPLVGDVDSMLPPQGNVYQSLEPVSVNLFDTAAYCEPRVYQQLEPVSKNDYRLDMGKFVEQKFYQELNPIPVNNSKLPNNEKKTYQQLRSVPDLHFIGERYGARSSTQTTQQKPEIPPEYATSKLYQQLSKPPKKQVKTNYPPERKSYHQLRPSGYTEKPKHNLSKSFSQRVNVSTPRPVTIQASPKAYYQHQTYHHQPYEAFQNVRAGSYENDNNMTDSTINLSPMPNLSFSNKTHSVQTGFQEHKPKVYLELRNPVPRKPTTIPSGSLRTNFATDLPNQDTARSYDDYNTAQQTNVRYQNIHPLHSHLQANDEQPKMRLPSPYEFKLPQTNMSNKYKMPKILGPSEYNNSQGNIGAQQVQHISTNHSLKPSETVSSCDVVPSYHVDEGISFSLPKATVCSDNLNISGIVKNHEDLNHLGNNYERNKLPTMNSDLPPEISHDLANQPRDSYCSNSDFAQVCSAVFQNKSIENLSNDKRSSVFKEKSYSLTNETDFNYDSNTSSSKFSIGNSCNKYEVTSGIDSNVPVNLERKSILVLENGSFSESKNNVSPDLGLENVISSTGNPQPCSSNIDSTQQGFKRNKYLYEKNEDPFHFSNTKGFSNLSTHCESANKVTVRIRQNEIDKNVDSIPLTPNLNKITAVEEKLKKLVSEEPTDLSTSSHEHEIMTDSNISMDKNSPQSTKPPLEITNIQNWCSENDDETTGSPKITPPENAPDETNQVCFKSSSSFQSSSDPSTEVSIKGDSQFYSDEKFEAVTSVVTQAARIFCEKDLKNAEVLSKVDKKEKGLTAFQLSTMDNRILHDQNFELSSFETVDEVGSASVSSNANVETVVKLDQSAPQINSSNESNSVKKSSEASSAQFSIAPPNIFTKAHAECKDQNIFTTVETAEKTERDFNKTGGLKNVLSKSLKTTQYTSFIPKKKRILCKTKKLSSRLKGSKSNSAISTDLKSNISLSEKNFELSETSLLDKTSTAQSNSYNNSVSSEKKTSANKVKHLLSKKHEILQSEQHSERSQSTPLIEIQTGKLQIGRNEKVNTQYEHGNMVNSDHHEEKELHGEKAADVQCKTSQSIEIVPKQSCRSFGTRLSMKRKISESINKRIALIGDVKSCVEGSVKALNILNDKSVSIKDAVEKKYSRRVNTAINPDVLENKDDINNLTGKIKTVTKKLSSYKCKSLRIGTLQETPFLKRKRQYCKTKKYEAFSTETKAEPLLKSKYSKRIIKKKKLDFEPVELVKKPKKLLKRKYTLSKHKSLPIREDSSDNGTSRDTNSQRPCATVKYEFVDPLEEGLISDDEGEAMFPGFDTPLEEDDTVLGFDFNGDDEDLEPINEFLQQLDADSMTVECDPRSLLQPPGMTMLCPHCGKALDSHQELVDHLRWHDSTGNHVCSICLRAFGTQAQLDKHIKWNHDGGKRFSCPVCPKRFTTSYYVKKHLVTVHGQHEAEVKYICPECRFTFTSEKKLTKHMDKFHKKTLYQCNMCLKNFLKLVNLERHKRSHEEEGQNFPCAYCNKKFNNRVQLHSHWLVHSEKKLFTCEICNSNFTALPSLKRHKIVHAGEKLFRCDICQKSFTLMSTLKTHLLVHSGIKRFPCKLCDKTFNRQDVLNAHQWIHTGEKKFECDICFQKFRWRHAVKSHKLIYHSTEKPYECETCGKRFSHPDSFKKHGEVHAEKLYYCQICLKAFARPSSLKIHILIHTDLKPFVCDLCNAAFRHKSHLRNHFLVHTNDKPWLCKFCNRMYKDRSQLRRHKRVVHCKNFFKEVLPGMPESLKTVDNFEMITKGESTLHTNQECFQESDVLDSDNLMSQSSKHFILNNLEGSISISEKDSVPHSMEDKSSNKDENEISSSNLEDHATDPEDNYMTQTNDGGPLKQEKVLPPSAF